MVMDKLQFDGPVVLAILDGVGLAADSAGNAVSRARTPFLGKVARDYLHVALDASGQAVGLLPGQMGNSEVGHNTMGAGRVFRQGIAHMVKSRGKRCPPAFTDDLIVTHDHQSMHLCKITFQRIQKLKDAL